MRKRKVYRGGWRDITEAYRKRFPEESGVTKSALQMRSQRDDVKVMRVILDVLSRFDAHVSARAREVSRIKTAINNRSKEAQP